jgi:hypothetical protein
MQLKCQLEEEKARRITESEERLDERREFEKKIAELSGELVRLQLDLDAS